MIPTKIKQIAICVALATGVYIPVAEAASLGKIHVKSALGQPLRAELELNANSKELSTLGVKLAPLSSFQRAEIPYTNTLSSLKFTIDKDPNKPIIRITSEKPIFDPFFDFLLEMTWANGNLIREYTFLLDPVEPTPKTADGPIINSPVETEAPKPASSYSANPEYTPTSQPEPTAVKPAQPTVTEVSRPQPATNATPAPTEDKWLVQRGDTLSKIARQAKSAEVSLDQMLLTLYRNNKDAFISSNMNRLKSGAILSLPDANTAKSVSTSEARAAVVAHAADWNAYRRKLAEATDNLPARTEAESTQSSGGSVSNISDKSASDANNRDQLKVSPTNATQKPGTSEEDKIAKERAAKEAKERLAQLEQNLTDLQKLVDLKNKNAAALTPAAPATETSTPAVTVPVTTPVVAETPAPEPKPEEATPPAPPAPEPAAAPTSSNVPPPEPDEPEPPTLIEKAIEFLGLPEVWAAAGGLLALLLAYIGIRTLRSNREDNEFDAFADIETTHPRVEEELHEASFESEVSSLSSAGQIEELKPIEQSVDVEIEEIQAIEPEPIPVPPARPAPEPQPTPEPPAAPSFDYASVNLDLASENSEPTPAPVTTIEADTTSEEVVEEEPEDPPNEEATTKLLLANAYVEMGDTSGARELLNEVLQEGSNTQKKEATALLATLSDEDDTAAPTPPAPAEPRAEANFDLDDEFDTLSDEDVTGDDDGQSDEVNPVAEADVMIAYGRETQAEEILLEALANTPENTDIHTRLLDIYTRREAKPEFDNIAKALFTQTQGEGAAWEKALAQADSMGMVINPPALASPGEQAFEAAQTAPLPITTPAPTEPVGIDGPEEVSTKLDLMQAYIEMGDTDGARELLNEILAEGSDSQKAEANRLMESMG